MLPKSLHSSPEERNDANNKDDTPNVCHFASHPECDDYNKESYKNKSLDRSDKSTKQSLVNNISYSEGILKCLLFLIYYLKQFVHCQKHQTSDGKIIYQYMAYFGIASVYFDMQVIQELHSMILLWKELCSDVLQYWPEGAECLEEQLSVDEIKRWKELKHAMLLQCCRGQCGSSSFPAMLQYWDLDHFFSFPVDLNLQNNPSDFVTLQMAKFGDRFFDDVVLVCNIGSTSPTVPNFFVPIFGSFPYHYKLLQQVKNFDGMGRQASDRSNNNGKRSQSETSKRSGSAGSSTSSSTTGGGHYRAGSTGSCGSSGRGDDEEDGGRKQGRPPRYTCNAPHAIQWEEEEEEDSKDHNEAASTATAPWPLSRDDSCSEPGKSKTMKTPHKTAKPIVYDLVIRCSNGMDMLAVTSPMMNLPLSGDDPHDELPATTPAVSNEIFTVRCCCEGYHDKLLYWNWVPRSYKNLRMLCLPVYYCEPVTAQATDDHVLPPHHSPDTTEAVSVTSLLPPPGGGSDVQFKDTLKILCTVVGTVYYNLYNNRCYFDRGLNVYDIFVRRDLHTGKVISVSIHVMLCQLEDRDEDTVRTSTNEKLMSLANSIYSPYQHTEYKELAEGVLTIMKHCPPYESDLDVLHALLTYHDWCVPFTNTAIAFVQ